MTGSEPDDTIPRHLRPDCVSIFKAKSPSMGDQSLAQHTWEVLSRLSDQYRIRKRLNHAEDNQRLWTALFWGCFLHDFGKAAAGFQEILRLDGKKPAIPLPWAEGKHRHEVLSLVFVNWVLAREHPDRLMVMNVVAYHHKDSQTIFEKYGAGRRSSEQNQRIAFLIQQLNSSDVTALWTWLAEYRDAWRLSLGFEDISAYTLVTLDEAKRVYSADSLCAVLDELSQYTVGLEDSIIPYAHVLENVLARGLILTADHAASAGSGRFPDMRLNMMRVENMLGKGIELYSTQRAMCRVGPGSAILTAPTGSGKTEAALLWAARQMEHQPAARLFYTLPYQASMNAMAKRLCEGLFQIHLADPENQDVAIQHSRATLKYYQDLMEADGSANPSASARAAKQRRDQARLNYYPVQIFSPYQMLKAAFQLKGYEALLLDYTGSLFIFDEIHAYDAKRLAQIIETVRWLREHFRARFLIMTATLPPMIREKLDDVLDNPVYISADSRLYGDSQRHRVHLLEGHLLDNLDRPLADWRAGRSPLICCNTVARAQQAYDTIKQAIAEAGLDPRDQCLLLHGRFNGRDRNEKENLLSQWVGVGTHQAGRSPRIVVATQVVEVSLNIDLDTIYTDPAPLEALLQRFGRVNRSRKERVYSPVHVFREPVNQQESRPYDHHLVEAGLAALEAWDGQLIDEAQVTDMLGAVYVGEARNRWEHAYGSTARSFTAILNGLVPFQSADIELRRRFFEMFDGVQVLPAGCQEDYDNAIEERCYLDSMQYLVNMSYGQLQSLKRWAHQADEEFIYRLDDAVPYDSEYGLQIARARQALASANVEDDDL